MSPGAGFTIDSEISLYRARSKHRTHHVAIMPLDLPDQLMGWRTVSLQDWSRSIARYDGIYNASRRNHKLRRAWKDTAPYPDGYLVRTNSPDTPSITTTVRRNEMWPLTSSSIQVVRYQGGRYSVVEDESSPSDVLLNEAARRMTSPVTFTDLPGAAHTTKQVLGALKNKRLLVSSWQGQRDHDVDADLLWWLAAGDDVADAIAELAERFEPLVDTWPMNIKGDRFMSNLDSLNNRMTGLVVRDHDLDDKERRGHIVTTLLTFFNRVEEETGIPKVDRNLEGMANTVMANRENIPDVRDAIIEAHPNLVPHDPGPSRTHTVELPKPVVRAKAISLVG